MIEYDPLLANGILPYSAKHYIEGNGMAIPVASEVSTQYNPKQQTVDEFVPKEGKKNSTWKKWLAAIVGTGVTLYALKKIGKLKSIDIKGKYSQYVKPVIDWTINKSTSIFNTVKNYFTKK